LLFFAIVYWLPVSGYKIGLIKRKGEDTSFENIGMLAEMHRDIA
jgi:hypothetical protein